MPALPQGWCQEGPGANMLAVTAWVGSWAHVTSTNIPLTKPVIWPRSKQWAGKNILPAVGGPQSNTPMPVFVSHITVR